MVEIEKIGEESFISFDKKNISKVPHVAGVEEHQNLSPRCNKSDPTRKLK